MKQNNFIADFFYEKRLTEIENGLPVNRISLYLSDCGDYFEIIGDNTGVITIKNIKEIIIKFGKPIEIEIDTTNFPYEFNYLEKFVDDKNIELNFKDLKKIKKGDITY